ncbi:LuxR family transcriptional regulator [Reticulibacter mediterranei]|uniref:LuxR family transcriptional regulator n=1 Tax=Reticulibacter mediterranei TaxID=2778369 RepID=A0A8J3N838_9CHLR|nr:adenylate/guanylate cyclase domain-containing protein [Reticulibacter mediterranei]GHO97847.1 LuxR family transcriptional regulator [Reticulibacter mediterranei]
MRPLPTGTVTLLFTDIEGSTRLLRRLGPRYAEVLAECRALLRAAFAQWRGHEVDTQGDAFFVAFTRAIDAVSAALTIQRTLHAHQWLDDAKVRVRIGVHTGEPQSTDEGYIGMDVHRAARIMSVAHGGQVLLSRTTSDLIKDEMPDAVTLRDMGEHHLKDIAGPTQLFQLEIPGIPIDFPQLLTAQPQRLLHHFPSQLTPFIGREQERKKIGELVSRVDARLITLVGAAGVGKTRLAVQVASELFAHFPGGLFFVALAQVNDAGGVLPAIAQALDLQEEQGRPLLDCLQQALHLRRTLLLLDNFEQVRNASLDIIRLLAACPLMKVLITSREVLHVQAEQVFDVSPLSLPAATHSQEPAALLQCEAIALFVQRAQAVKPGFQLTALNAAAVMNICTRLDGLPLAIELAASRVRYFPPQALLTRLEHGLGILSGNAHDIPERQQTLQRALAWSYELLDAREQEVFRRLSVFVQGGTLAAIEQVCSAAGSIPLEMLAVLEALVDKSLLLQQVQSDGEMRFWMLRTLREYGLECLELANEGEVTRTAHARYYLAWIEQTTSHSFSAERMGGLHLVDQEYDNLRAALEWLLQYAEAGQQELAEEALRFCIALCLYWEIRGYFNEGLTLFKRALAVGTEAKASILAEALYMAGFMTLVQEGSEPAEALLSRSQQLFQANGDKLGMANILRMQGALSSMRGRYKIARQLLENALRLYEEQENKKRVMNAREDLAQIALAQCNYEQARMLLEENLAEYQWQEEHYFTAYCFYDLACVYFFSQHDLVEAQKLAERSLTLFKAHGDRRFMAFVFCLLGQIHIAQGQESEARSLLEESLLTFKSIEDRSGTVEALLAHARLMMRQGSYQEAQTDYSEGCKLVRALGEKRLAAECLEGIGEVLVKLGKPEEAAQVWGTAAEIRATIVAPMHRIYRPFYRESVSAARLWLGDEAFQRAWATGRRLPLEHVLMRLVEA